VAGLDRPHLGSLVCGAGHELRITGRCLNEDLGGAPTAAFEDLASRHGIVRAFRRERSSATTGPDHLGPAGGPRPLTVLRHTNDWRGLTWFDSEENVVWLCACARHRSGQPGDAFPFFRALEATGRIWPSEEDYEALAADRGEQFAAFVLDDAPLLLVRARKAPGTEQVLVIGREPVTVVVHIVETLEETYVAVSTLTLTPSQYQLLLVALYPDRAYDDWRVEQRLPTRDLDYARAEICVSIIHG
jgi:hypothetical protein